MTTIVPATISYPKLDPYIENITKGLDTVAYHIQTYFEAAKKENIDEEDAKRYLRRKIPNSTFYKYLPADTPKRQYTKNYGYTKKDISDDSPPAEKKTQVESSSTSATDSEGNEVEQEEPLGVEPLTDSDRVRELEAIIEDKDKRIDELVRDVKAIQAANPESSSNPQLVKNLQQEVKRLLAREKELQERVSMPEIKSAADLAANETVFIQEFKEERDKFDSILIIRKVPIPGVLEYYCSDGKVVRRVAHATPT